MSYKLDLAIQGTFGLVRNAAYFARYRTAKSRYDIVPGYRHRAEPSYCNATATKDDWQSEVYAYAAAAMDREGLCSVFDIGCGSAFKLVQFLGDRQTIGFDVSETVRFLRERYPDRRWEVSDFSAADHYPPPDLVVCSDVVEHVSDPDALMAFITALCPRRVVLSTPDRNLVYPPGSRFLLGPPQNPTHLREWTFAEFARYAARHLDILEHVITNRAQATQMVYGSPHRQASRSRP